MQAQQPKLVVPGSDSDGDDDDLPEMRTLPRISTGEKQAWLEDGLSDAAGVAAGSTPLALTAEEEALLGQLPEPGSSQLRDRLRAARLRSLTLETELEMHLAQVGKLQEQLESMDRDKAVLEATLTRHIRETDAKPASLLGRWSTKPAATEHRIKSLSDALKVVEEENTLLKARLLSAARTSPDLADDLRAHDLVRARARLDAEPPASSAQASSEAAAAPGTAEPAEIRRARQVREENSWLMASLVSIKVENAELKGDHQRVKRSLVRAKETEKALREEIEELKLQLERLGQPPPPSSGPSRLFPGHRRSGAASQEQPEDEEDTLDWTDLGSSTPPSHPALSSPDTSPLASHSASLHLT